MNIDVIQMMYDYNTWANARILEEAALLTPVQYIAAGSASFSSVRDTLVHTLWAQALWLSRWQGRGNFPWYDPADYPDVPTLRARWQELDAATHAFVAAQDDETLARVVHYENSRTIPMAHPLWHLMLHQVNHGTQHRSEVAVLLTEYGHSPGWMDLIVYLDAVQRSSR